MTRDIPVFDIAQAAHAGPGAALAFVGGEGHNETPGSRQSSSDPEVHLRGDWAWRPYRKDLGSLDRYKGAPLTPRRYCSPSVYAGLDAQAKTHYMPDFRA